MLKTSHGSYSRLSLTSVAEMKSSHSGRVRRIESFEHVPPKNVKIQIKQRVDVAVDWHSHKSSSGHVWEHFLSWTFMCFFPFLSVAANSYIPKGNRNFSAALKLLPWCNQSKKPTTTTCFMEMLQELSWKIWLLLRNTLSPLPFCHFTPLSVWVETHVTCCCSCYGKQLFSLQHREKY